MRSCKHPANRLLPWYVNHSLSGGEETSVRDHLGTCAVCNDELDRLDAITRSMRESGIVISSEDRHGIASLRPAWRSWAVAASLVLIGSLAIYQSMRPVRETAWAPPPGRINDGGAPAGEPAGVPTGTGARPGIATGVLLDLAGGPLRGAWEAPVLELRPGTDSVTFLFTVHVDPGAACAVALRGPDKSLLHHQEVLLHPDPMGRVAVTVEAAVFAEPGEYALEVSLLSGGAVRPYVYPFRVGVPAEPSTH